MISADSKVGAAGPQSGSYVAVDSWANLQAYVSASYAGSKVHCTNVGYEGSDWYVNAAGTELVQFAPITLYRQIEAFARAPSGTINTGSSGNITFGTAAPRAYTEGLYVYLPSIATTPAITAGWYWCVMSTTTLGTLYASKGGAAINFTVGASYTGVTTSINFLTTTVRGGVSSFFKMLSFSGVAQTTNNSNAKTIYPTFGGQSLITQALTSAVSHKIQYDIFTVGSTLQYCTPSLASTSADSTIFANTANDCDFTITLVNATSTATDWIILNAGSLTLRPR